MGNSTNPFLKSPFDDLLGDTPALPAQNQSERRPSTDGTSDLLPPEKYRPLFDAAAKKYGVPESDIMALAQQESGYDPDAIGTSTPYGHAKGMLQYLDDTANNLGINQFDPEASIDAAARQYAQRIKQGYSPDEALMAHFGGDDRKQWGKKTAEYGREVREKANRIQQLLGNQPMPDTVANDPGETAKEKGLPGAVVEKAQQLQQDISAITRPQQDEQEPGFLDNLSDLAKLGNLGLNMAAQDVRELVGRIPGVGKTIQSGLDYADYALSGKTSEDILNQTEQNTVKAMTPQMQEALQKQWWDDKTNSFGPAIKDWRSYVGGVVESLPEQVLTMGPSLKLAKAAYGAKIAAGAAPEVAAKAAAKAATIAGSITEGLLGGAQSGRSVRDEINALPDDVLAKSDAVKAMMKNGMSLDDARKQLAEDQGTQAFLTSGAITGLFGGMGDRTLAKIFSEAGGGAMKRALSGMAKEALSEGLFEEAPQSAGQQLSENLAMQPADNRKLTKDVLGQTIGGAILGAVQGGGMGAVGGLTGSHNQPESIPPAATAQSASQPSSAPTPEPAPGPLSRAVQKTEANMPDEPASQSQQQPQPVTVTTPHGQTITGFMDSYHEDDNGNYVARVLGTDGQTYHFTNQDGVTIQPINTPKEAQEEQQKDSNKAPKEQQKSPVLPFDVDQETGEILEPKPAANASGEKAPAQNAYDQMDEPELRQRLKYLTKQAKVSGWDKSLLNERRKVEGAINALNDAKNAQSEAAQSDSEPLTEHNEQPEQPKASSTASTGSMDDMLAAFDQEVSTTKRQPQETNNAEASNIRNEQPESAEVSQKQGDDNATPVQPDESRSAVQQPGGTSIADGTTESSGTDVLPVPEATNTNLALNKDGTQKWFGSKPKALEYLTKKGISDTHEVRKNGRRWEIHDKEASHEQQKGTQETPEEQQNNAAVLPESKSPVTETGEQSAIPDKSVSTKKAQRSAEIIGNPGDTVRVTSSGGEAQSGQMLRVDSIADNGDVSYTDPRSGYKGTITGKQLEKDSREGAAYSSIEQPTTQPENESTKEAPKEHQKGINKAPKEQQKTTKADTVKNEQQFADNKIFTADKVAAARARLKSKLGQLNSGLDPEMLVDGMTLAGAYIESGVRSFSDYAKAMIDDLGDAVKPYLLSFYEGVRNYPGLDTEGMTSVENAKREYASLMTPQDSQAANTDDVEDKPAQNKTEQENVNDTQPDTTDAGKSAPAVRTEPVPADEGERGTESVPGQPAERSGTKSGRSQAGSTEQQSTGRDEQPGAGSGQPVQSSGRDSAAERDRADSRPTSSAGNYRIERGELTRKGSWKETAERNVQIIELVNQLDKEGRYATDEEKSLLVQYTGMGASEIANSLFPDQYGRYKQGWEELGKRLKTALNKEQYEQASRTTQYAHYTSEGVIRSIYDAVSRLGFNGGMVMEPGMGTGHFIGMMPDAMTVDGQYTGIEYDYITSRIGHYLYPQANVINGDYTKTPLPRDYFDMAIGNPPFSSTKITNDPEYKKHGFMLHDYFFAKTIDRVKPGGLLVFVTSKGTLDKANSKLREYLAERSHFLGAVRLPQTAFKANAGTEVVTDVIFLKKLEKGETSRLSDWQALAINEVQTPQGPALINDYYVQHPEMVLGTHALTGSMYRKNEYTVEPVEGVDIEEAFAKAIQNLPENVYRPERGSSAERAVVRDRDFNPKHRKEGGLYVSDNGKLMQVNDGTGVELTQRAGTGGKLIDLKPKETAFLKAYTGLRDALKQAQYDQLNDGYWQESLKTLNDTYDNFVKDHGNLLAYSTIERTDAEGNTVTTKRFKNDPLLRLDAEGALAYALEKLKEDGTIAKGDVLNGRVLKRDEEPQIVTTQDAMFVSLNQLGRLDIDDIARLAGTDRDTVISDLGTAIYDHPGKGWVPADEYLSGNVVRKLKEAQAAAVSNPKYQRNVDALLAVQPRPLGPQEISVRLGANWIPPSDIEQFGKDVIGENVSVSYSPITGQWDVEQTGDNKSEYGFKAMSAGKILESTLNNRQIKITWRDQDGKTHVDTEATEKANDIAKKMRVAFSSWVWTDTKRSERLVNHYNDNFNNIVARQFDGSHLTLPGVSSRFKLYPHQKRAIWRTIQEGDSYYAHAVGAGKTFTMIAAGMEQKRLGLIDKPMYVVPNHMLAQFSREFLELYPTANIMVADEHNFHTHNRRRFVAQAALNNPDAIVITHSGFGRIAMSDAYYSNFIGEEIAKWKHALNELEGDDDRITRKRIEKKIEGMERKLEGKQGKDKKDNVLNFEELGVDYLFVDEAHEFRKLDFVTNQGNVKGIDPNGSQRAQDLFMKVKYLREKSDRALTMASGTPVTNTMGELYTVQRFFQPDQMEEDGTDTFDAWASMYGDITAGFEQNAAGGYEVVSRFAKFQNVPELMSRVRSFMDILTSSNLGELVQRPTVEGGGRNVIVTPVPSGYKEYQKSLGDRITKIRNRKGRVQKGDDIILNVIADGRFSAIDMRFVDNAQPSDPNSKLNQLLDDMISAYDETKDYEYTDNNGKKDPLKGSSLMMFTDIGLGEQSAANRGFDMKAWITKRLTDAGIPREHIAFMRDFKEHAKKERLFSDMRSGKKRILIGGKEMETGTNVQKRLSHLFHLDAPWFPASVEQREGRIIRQGNQNPKVIVKAYATKGSYDSTMWGMNARKAKFIEQAMNGDTSVRSLEDVSEASAFETAAALASGDERYMKLAGLRADVERLSRLHNAHYDDQNRLRRDKHQSQQIVSHASDYIAELNEAIAKRQPIKAGEFMAKVGKKSFDARDQFSTALFDAFRDKADAYTEDEQKLGEIGGFDIIFTGTTLKGSGQYVAELHVDIPGDPNPLIEYPISTDVAINGIATRAANQVNGLDKQLTDAISTKEQNERRITQIDSRLGAPFPDEAELLEKMADVQALEDELTKEQLAEGGETANGEAAVATLEIDPEPAINSNVEQTETPEFKRWFGNSKVVDDKGNPLVVYHGTLAGNITTFRPDDFFGSGMFGKGINFTSSESDAKKYASTDAMVNLDLPGKASIMSDALGIDYNKAKEHLTNKGDGVVIPAYLSIQNPLVVGKEKLNIPESQFNLAAAEAGLEDADEVARLYRRFEKAPDGKAQFEVIANRRGATRIYRQLASILNNDGVIVTPDAAPISEGATHYLVFEPNQIKSATDNNGEFDPNNDDILHHLNTGRRKASPDAVSDLEKATGSVNDEAGINQFIDLARKAEQSAGRDKGNNPQKVLATLRDAEQSGKYNTEGMQLAQWLIRRYQHLADTLDINLAQGDDDKPYGSYNVANRLITLFSEYRNQSGDINTPDTLTAVHEIMHHTERMLPADVQEHIAGMWLDALRDRLSYYNSTGQGEKAELLSDFVAGMYGDEAAQARGIQAILNGTLPASDYQFANPSEYWAENSSRIIAERKNSSWVKKAVAALRSIFDKIRSLLGIETPTTLDTALDSVLKGDGKLKSGKILAQVGDDLYQLSERFGGKSDMEKLSSPNFRSFAPKEKSAKGIPLNELKRIVDELKASYNGNIPLDIRAVEKMEEAYGPDISDDVRNAKGAYHPRARAAVFAAANLLHARDVRETFRHEILGHYGLNTFTPEDKKALLQKIVDTRKSPSLKPAWDFIDRNYANEPESVKAEEVFAHIAEKSDTYKNPDWREKVLNFLNKLLRKTGLSKRPLTLAELRETARAIAKGIRSGERVQQNFPQDDSAQFSKSSPAQKEPVVTAATESIDRDESRDWDSLGRIIADQSIGSRLFVHPRTIAAVHPEFTPVYKTAISQMETRDANVAELGEHVAGYDELTQPGKLQVNKVLELGRLLERNFSEDELKAGVETPASKKVASVDDEGKPVVVDVPLTPLLSKKGEVIKLSGAEAKAYTDLRNMFDVALDKFRDQVLEEYGFPELVGTKDAGRGILEMITPETPATRAETLTNMARFVSEIEQAKRTGYVPLARYGDYVVTVKEKIADLKFLGDSKDYDIVQGVTDEMAPRVQELGGEFDKKENGWRVPKSARPELKRMAEKTVYSERVETGMVGKWYERRGKTVEDVPEVKKAIAKARKDWVGDNKDRRIVAFKVKTKKPDEPVSLTDVDALASVANIDNATWDAIRDKLSDAIKGQGFRRHFFHSENIPGYTGDFERAISDYIIGMSGYLSRRAHMKRWDAAVSNIKDKGKLFNYASKYRDYVNSPQEEFTFLRQIGFLSYIAGVPATAFANLTQVPFLTMPTLSQIAPQALAGKEIARAYKDALAMFSPMRKKLEMFDPDKAPADVRDIMKKAWADGVFVPLESFERMLTASKPTAGRRKLARAVGTGTQGLSYLFTFAERLNRLVTYMAAARLANKRAVKENAHRVLKNDALAKSTVLGKNWSPENLAEWVVDESQFRMGKANRPEAMRGVGAAIMQFKSFMLQTFEAWYRMAKLHDKRGAMMMAASIAALMVMSGVWGLPGADDLRKLIEQVYKQMTDEDLDLKTELRGWIMRTSGSQVISQIVNKGITYPAGLDLTRVGMGTVAPDSSLGMLGIPADLILGRTSRAVEKAATGDMLGAASEMAPNVIKNPLTALGWGKDGVRDKYGKVILPSNMLSTRDLVMKSLGFQPSIVTDVKDYEYAQRRQETAEDQLKRRYTTEIARNLANIERAKSPEDKAEYEQDLRDVFAQIKEHNDKATDPSEIIKISPRTIRGRVVQEMEGVKSTWGKERKQARGAAQDMRRQFGLEEEEQDK